MIRLDSPLLVVALFSITPLSGAQAASPWHLALAHDRDGNIQAGNHESLISGIRSGCQVRVAWGTKRAADPSRTIEHSATPVWISIRNGKEVEVQLSDFVINLAVLGEPAADHPRRERFGGTDKAVNWRANLKTDGSFDAVWYDMATGKFITRVPQRHQMKWFTDCKPDSSEPLFPSAN
ncbi:MAG: hypothetical protein ABJP02_18095 [Parasphingorhabdus sp.]|uniref:hypothetical protein n=1 Tax=Parasphingorhabdus sp. TaxID=2709688 RepID=UPI00329739FE